MSRVYHLQTNVHIWKDAKLEQLDTFLESLVDSNALQLPWDTFEISADGLHFTDDGFKVFKNCFVELVSALVRSTTQRVIVLSDSTIGQHDWDNNDNWTGEASHAIETKLAERCSVPVLVDAVCGSGFVGMSEEKLHFYPRLKQLAVSSGDVVVFVGGWNDTRAPVSTLLQAVKGCARVL